MKNSADQGECYPQRPKAEVDIDTLRDFRSSHCQEGKCKICFSRMCLHTFTLLSKHFFVNIILYKTRSSLF